MKIYCFYLIDDEITVDKYIGVKADTINRMGNKDYSLYAFTPEKSVRDEFISFRDMDKFYEKVINIERCDYEDFCEDNGDYLLEYHTVSTKTIENGVYKSTNVLILTNAIEADTIIFYSEQYLLEILSENLTETNFYTITSIKFEDKLNKILLNTFYLGTILDTYYEINDNIPEIKIDQLSLFITIFSNTFNNKIKKDY